MAVPTTLEFVPSFTTDDCMYYKAAQVPVTISAAAPNTIESAQFVYDREDLHQPKFMTSKDYTPTLTI